MTECCNHARGTGASLVATGATSGSRRNPVLTHARSFHRSFHSFSQNASSRGVPTVHDGKTGSNINIRISLAIAAFYHAAAAVNGYSDYINVLISNLTFAIRYSCLQSFHRKLTSLHAASRVTLTQSLDNGTRIQQNPQLEWSSSFSLLPVRLQLRRLSLETRLFLPQSALEQLLQASNARNNFVTRPLHRDIISTASTVIRRMEMPIAIISCRILSSFAWSTRKTQRGLRRHPRVLRPDETIGISSYLYSALDIQSIDHFNKNGNDDATSAVEIKVHAAALPKGTYARIASARGRLQPRRLATPSRTPATQQLYLPHYGNSPRRQKESMEKRTSS